MARVRQDGLGALPAGDPLLGSLVIQDSTFLRLSLRLAGWLPPLRRPECSGVRVQVWLHPSRDLPEVVELTSVKINDRGSWNRTVLGDPARLATLVGQTLVVDLGYYSHVGFQRLFAAGVHLVTRLYPKTTVTVEADCPIQPPLPDADGGRITVVADQRVTLGSPNNHTSVVLPGLRLVTADVTPRAKTGHRSPTPRRYEIVTDRWDLTAAEVVQVYLWRWQIELFLRWLKGQLHLPRLLGYSENAVELSVWLAILVHLLTPARGPRPRSRQTLPAPPRSPRRRPPAPRPRPRSPRHANPRPAPPTGLRPPPTRAYLAPAISRRTEFKTALD